MTKRLSEAKPQHRANEAERWADTTVTARPRAGDSVEEAVETPPAIDLQAEHDEYYGEGDPWRPPTAVMCSTPGRDGVPYYDDNLDLDVHAAPRSYDAWGPDETFVVSGTLGPKGRWGSRIQARQWMLAKFGVILEEYAISGKAAFRTWKPGYGPQKKN